MEIRPVTESESDAIPDVVRRSFRASYSLSPTTIDAIVEERFAPDRVRDRAGRPDTVVLVAERDGTLVGVAEGRVEDDAGEVVWLHVAPAARGRGVGTRLFEELRDGVREGGVDGLRVRVLAGNAEGEAFVERLGFSTVEQATVEVGGEELAERVYARVPDGEETTPTVPDTTTVDGETLTVDRDDPIPGGDAEFFPASRTDSGDGDLYGFYCSYCGSVTGAMDELERIECETCGNTHRPDEWDDAYL